MCVGMKLCCWHVCRCVLKNIYQILCKHVFAFIENFCILNIYLFSVYICIFFDISDVVYIIHKSSLSNHVNRRRNPRHNRRQLRGRDHSGTSGDRSSIFQDLVLLGSRELFAVGLFDIVIFSGCQRYPATPCRLVKGWFVMVSQYIDYRGMRDLVDQLCWIVDNICYTQNSLQYI